MIKTGLTRYVVKVDGEAWAAFFSEKKAIGYAFKIKYECANQDEPVFPKTEIVEEHLSE